MTARFIRIWEYERNKSFPRPTGSSQSNYTILLRSGVNVGHCLHYSDSRFFLLVVPRGLVCREGVDIDIIFLLWELRGIPLRREQTI